MATFYGGLWVDSKRLREESVRRAKGKPGEYRLGSQERKGIRLSIMNKA